MTTECRNSGVLFDESAYTEVEARLEVRNFWRKDV